MIVLSQSSKVSDLVACVEGIRITSRPQYRDSAASASIGACYKEA